MAHEARGAVPASTPSVAKPAPSIGTRASAAQLKESGIQVQSPTDRFREEILRQLAGLRAKGLNREESIAALFPQTVLPISTYEDVVTALVSGAHMLFFGPSGAGKTSLAKDLWGLFPKGVWVITDCPVLDHPM